MTLRPLATGPEASTDLAATPVEAGSKPMNELSRLIGVFFEPKKAFAEIAHSAHIRAVCHGAVA